MQYKLLFTDLDGTVLNYGELRENVRRTVEKLKKNGITVVVTTGRPYCTALPIARQLGLDDGYLIVFNGSQIYHNGELVYNDKLSKERLEFIVKNGRRLNASQVVWSGDKLYVEQRNEQTLSYQERTPVECNFVDDLTELDGATKVLWNNSEEEVAMFFNEMKNTEGVNVHPSHPLFLEFVGLNCSKGIALKFVANKLGVDISETVAIGDSYNDVSMITAAGLGVAMGNAPDQVKASAKMVVGDVADDGFVEMAEKCFGQALTD